MIWHSIQEFSSQLFHIEFDWFHIQFDFTFNLISHSLWFHIQFDDFTFNLIIHIWRFDIQFDFTFNLTISHSNWHSLSGTAVPTAPTVSMAAAAQPDIEVLVRGIWPKRVAPCHQTHLFFTVTFYLFYLVLDLPIHSVAQVIITWAANPRHALRRASVPWPVKFQFRTWIVFHF